VLDLCLLLRKQEKTKQKENKVCKQLKTGNMKTTMKQLAAGTILALLLMAANVHAEGKDATKASSLESIETTMEIESWMIDDNIWNITSSNALEDVTEESLNLEDWMISDENWNSIQNMNNETEEESSLELESWMTDTLVWNR